jgi:hypothetical protein
MGVTTYDLGGDFLIRADLCHAAAGALDSLADRLRLPTYRPGRREKVSALARALIRFNFGHEEGVRGDCVRLTMLGDRLFSHYDRATSTTTDIDHVFRVLAPYVEPGSWLAYFDGHAWAFRWELGRCGSVGMIPAPLPKVPA